MSDHTIHSGSSVQRTPSLPLGRPVLSSAQRRLWFVDQLRPGGVAYNVPFAYRLRGSVDRAALAAAIRWVVRRHDVLRSRFVDVKGEPYLVVDVPARYDMDFVDVSDSADPESVALDWARTDGDRPMDLATDRLFRATLIRLADDDHLLSITTNHIVFDGLSRRPFERELSAAYLACLRGGEPELPPPPVRFLDQVPDSPAAEDLAYWRGRLHGASADLALPTVPGHAHVDGDAADLISLTLPDTVVRELVARARAARATVYMVTLAAFHALLSRYTGAEDIVIGTPTAGRGDPDLDDAIGFFTDTVPIRIVSGRTATFAQLVSVVRDAVLGALDHDQVSLERLLEAAGSAAFGVDTPFRVWFDIFTPSEGIDLAGVTAPSFDPASPVTRFDLEMHVKIRHGGAVDLRLLYRSGLFAPEVMHGFLRYYRAFLTAVAADFDMPIGAVPIMSSAEHDQLVRGLRGAPRPVPDAALAVRFAQCVRAHPAAPAVADRDVVLTYQELGDRADQLAQLLRGYGAAPHHVVGLLLPRGLDCVTALLAIVKTGAAYLPIDPELPAERIRFMLADSGARLLVTTSALHALVQDGPPAIRLDAPAQPPTTPAMPAVDPLVDAATYIIYTSGSTGRPKGIAMPGRPLLNVLQWQLDRSTVSGPTAQFSSISFDPSFLEVFSTWLAGGLLVLVPEDVRRDPERLFDHLVTGGVRRLFCPPQVIEQLAQVAATREVLPPLTEIVPAGEQLRITPAIRAFVVRLRAAGHDVFVDNEYGPNETQIVTAHRLAGDPGDWPDTPPIGRAIPNCQAHVLDADLRPVPPGVLGEVYLGGRCVADGYTARSDTTADRFVPDPFTDRPGGRLYRTGDLARHNGDGVLTFAGRADHQVKIRGYRIEPEEIEHALAANPGVVDAAVLPTADHQHLVACVVTRAVADPPTAEQLRAELKRQLPPYLVPGRFVFVSRLPRTAIGKLDRLAIAELVRAEPTGQTAPRTAPNWNSREAAIAGVWQSVIGIARVGRTDDFFDIGGHSLLATRVVAAIREVCDVELPVRALFDHRTVPELAAVVAELASVAPRRRIPCDTNEVRAISGQQRRLWFLDRIDPGSAAYVIPFAYRLTGPLNEVALRQTLTWIVGRHEALRTRFATIDGEPVPVIAIAAPVPVAFVDVSGRPDPLAAAVALAEADAGAAFDLAAGPLYRFRIVRLGVDDHLLAGAIHHTVFDGLSRLVLERELSAGYESFRSGRPPTHRAEPTRYTDYAAWQRDSMVQTAADHIAYWRGELGAAPVQTPLRRRSGSTPGGAAATIRFTVDPAVVRSLTEHARERGTTLATAALAGYHALLCRYSNSTDVITGTSTSGRGRPELQNVLGCFVNTVPIHTSITADTTSAQHLTRTRDAVLRALSHEDLPFDALVEALAPERDPGSNPIFQIWFDFWDEAVSGHALTLQGCRATPVRSPITRVRFDVELHLRRSDGDVLEGTLVYAEGMFDQDMMRGFVAHYEHLLAAMTAHPERPIRTIPLPSSADAAVRSSSSVPPGTVTDWFTEVARRQPDATAVTHDGPQISYGELDSRSARLTALLRDRGVRPETVVALIMPRGIDLIVALLAVGRAGAAYLPVDPDLPAERISFLLRDAGVAVAVTRAHRGTLDVTTIVLADTDVSAYPNELPRSAATDTNLAYVLYTSGSTGMPKGTAVTHGSLANLVHWHRKRYRLGPADRVCQTASMSFDASTWEIWPALTSGARLCLPRDRDRMSHEGLLRHFAEAGTTSAFVPTALAESLLREPLGRSTRLRHLLTGGDVLRCSPDHRPGLPVVNHYGPTETTVVATAAPLYDELPARPPIGTAIDNCHIHLLDGAGQPVPPYVTGEIFIGGRGVARGYVSRPDLTAAAFVPDPMADTPGARMYRTGDLGWRDSAGTLHFAGRVDHQIKIRGHRIEPAEVTAALLTHPDVTDAVVVAADGSRLVAYVTGWPDHDFGALRDHLRQRLPHYLVPDLFLAVVEFPRTTSNKVDLVRLPPPPVASTSRFVGPRNDHEQTLAQLWTELLDVARIGVHDDFFVLGGHSLTAVKLVERIRGRFAVTLPVRAVFDHRTVAELAEAVRAAVLADIEAMSDDEVAAALATPGSQP